MGSLKASTPSRLPGGRGRWASIPIGSKSQLKTQLKTMSACALVAALAACSDPGGLDLDAPSPFTPTDDGVITDGSVVAVIALDAPDAEDFILSATVPVPPGTYTDGALSVPLSVAGDGQIAVPTQVEVVSRYADPSQGADVVQLIAHVRRPEPVQPGQRIEYRVGLNPHQDYELELEPDVATLLQAPGAIKLLAHDPFGNAYSADLLHQYRQEESEAEIQLDGVCAKRIRTHHVMLPEQEESGALGTLPHLMGVHSYLTVFRGQDYATLDLHVHNGMDGRDVTTSADDLLDELFFRDLNLQLPSGWRVVFAFDTPGQGQITPQGGYTQTQLIEPLPGSKMHYMPRMSHFVRRLVIAKDSAADRALEHARSRDTAFCQPGTAPVGVELWSWWNAETARYFPQNNRLPELDYIGIGNVRGRLQGDLDRYENQLRTGAAGAYPMESGRLGWAHPWSTPYGGLAGGHEIYTYAGLETAWAAAPEGLRMSQLRMRGLVDRQPQVLYDKDGNHTRYETLVAYPADRDPFIPLWWYGTPTPGNNFFHFDGAPGFQEEHVANQSMLPDYYNALKGFQPIDYHHFVRYTYDLKVLAWLSNDALAKEMLEAAAENFRLSYHEYPNDNYGGVQPTGQLSAMRTVQEAPGMGVPMGRAEAWCINAAVATYAMGDDELRARYRPWFDRIATIFEDGQSTCTGNLMSYHIWNYYNGAYRVRQFMENAFLENTIKSIASTVYAGEDDAQASSLNQILVDSVRSSFEGRYFNEMEGAPWFNCAVGPRELSGGNFCQNAPQGTTSAGVNRHEGYSSLAYAYELSGDSFFLFRASQMLGGGDILTRLQEGQGVNLPNTAALLALAQETAQP